MATPERYHLLGEIGRGAMGIVYRALQVDLNREVALKVLWVPHELEADLVPRFRTEARVLAKLKHPGIVEVYDHGEMDGQLFISMEIVTGRTLREVIDRRTRVPLEEVRDWMAQAASALAHLHSEGILHRDIKPGNLMLCADGRIVIVDFGLVKDPRSPGRTMAGSAVGTPLYMAPENLRGPGAGPASDVFALALCTHELLTGVPYYSVVEFNPLSMDIVRRPSRGLGVEMPGLPGWIVDLQERALDAIPGKRPSALVYGEALRTARYRDVGRQVTRRTDEVIHHVTLEVHRPRRSIPWLALMVSAVAGLCLALALGTSPGRPPVGPPPAHGSPGPRGPAVERLSFLPTDHDVQVDFDIPRNEQCTVEIALEETPRPLHRLTTVAGARFLHTTFTGLRPDRVHVMRITSSGSRGRLERTFRTLGPAHGVRVAALLEARPRERKAVLMLLATAEESPDPRLVPSLVGLVPFQDPRRPADLRRIARIAAQMRDPDLAAALAGVLEGSQDPETRVLIRGALESSRWREDPARALPAPSPGGIMRGARAGTEVRGR